MSESDLPAEPPPAAPKARKPRAPRVTPPATVWARIQEHKVLQWSIGYLGAALALAHGQELVAHTFHWPDVVGRLVMGVLIVGFPIAVVLAWFHGHKRIKHISAGEMTALAVLLLAGGVVLTLLARSEHSANGERHAAAESTTAPAEAHLVQAVSNVPATAAVSSSAVRLAILPFENLSPDPSNEFFADGLHEEILSTLAQRVPSLDVISRTTMMMYRRAPKPTTEVAKELKVTHVLEGSVRREAKQVRLTLQLIDAVNDKHLWSRNYDRTLENALTLQSDVASEVASQLSVELAGGAPEAGPPTRDPEAYDLYLKARLGLQLLGPGQPAEEFRRVESLLSAAIARDPAFALAYAQRAGVRLLAFTFNHDTSVQAAEQTRADVAEARRLAGDHPVVLAAEGQYVSLVEQDHERALTKFQAAQARGLADSSWLQAETFVLFRVGRVEEALRLGDRLIALDPANPFLLSSIAAQRSMARQPQEALRIIDLALSRTPNFPILQSMRAGIIASEQGSGGLLLVAPTGRNSGDPSAQLEVQFSSLRVQGRFDELQTVVDGVSAQSVRVVTGGLTGISFGVGSRPVAEYRGWVAMLRGRPEQAKREGRAMLDFVARQPETKWNRWFLRTLAAEGHLFSGDTARARAVAAEALALTPRSTDFFGWLSAAAVGARVNAWGGDENAAMALLERLGTDTPGLSPVVVMVDPLYNVPLANNARFQAFVNRTKAQLAPPKQAQ